MKHLDALRERMWQELEDIPQQGAFGRSELDDAFKLIYSIKGIRDLEKPAAVSPADKPHDDKPETLPEPEPKVSTGEEHLTMAQAKDWLGKMQNADGTTGAHWNFEAASRLMVQRGIDCDPIDFWLTLNMMHSDYSKVAKAYSADNPNFYADLAAAFLCDEDAVEDKLVQYWEHIPKAN